MKTGGAAADAMGPDLRKLGGDSFRERWFEAVWTDREERVYPEWFGTCVPGIHTLPRALFHRFGVTDDGRNGLDPRWLTHGVLEFLPDSRRPAALYVTSGLSNPWGQMPEEAARDRGRASGLGFELVLETATRAAWPIELLQWLCAVQLLVAEGRLEGELLEPHDRIPLGIGVDGTASSRVRNLVVVEPTRYPSTFELASGRVAFLQLVGTTDEEHRLGAELGPEALLQSLKESSPFPITDPAR